jgi:hypothetical protein
MAEGETGGNVLDGLLPNQPTTNENRMRPEELLAMLQGGQSPPSPAMPADLMAMLTMGNAPDSSGMGMPSPQPMRQAMSPALQMPAPTISPETTLAATMLPPTPPNRKAVIGQAIGDFLQSVGAGLSHRGKAGQSTGAGAAMQMPFLLAQQREQQQQQQQQQTMQNALAVAKMRAEQQQAESQRDYQNRSLAQQAMEHAQTLGQQKELANRPNFQHFGTAKGGIIYGKTDATTGIFTKQGEIEGASDLTDLKVREVQRGEDVYYQYFPDGRPDQVVYETLKGKARPWGQPGAKSAVVDRNGQIIGVIDSESGVISNPTFAPGSEDLKGAARRTALPESSQQKLASFDASDVILDDIESYSKRIHTKEGLVARAGGGWRRIKSYAGYDADTTSLKSKAGEMGQIIRALGEVGALSEGDVQRGLNLLPVAPELTETEAGNMIRDLRNIIKKGRTNYRKQLGIEPKTPTDTNGGKPILVTAPNGKTYPFPTQKAADDFKRKAGIK